MDPGKPSMLMRSKLGPFSYNLFSTKFTILLSLVILAHNNINHQVVDRNNADYGFYEAGTTRTTDNNSLYGED